ncbi:MAG: helix-turn-helix transcriptional regulator [Sphingobium sp.]
MRIEDGDLLQAVHAGIFEAAPWTNFLNELRSRTGARCVTLMFRTAQEAPLVQIFAGDPLSLPLPGSAPGIAVPHYGRMRDNRVYALDELVDPTDLVGGALPVRLTGPGTAESIRMVRVTVDGGGQALLACLGGRISSSAVSALLATLAPHLRIALHSLIALERERVRATVATDAIGRLGAGWIILDEICHIIDCASNVEPMLQDGAHLRRGRHDRLTAASPAIDRLLTTLVRRAALEPAAAPEAISLSRQPPIGLLIRPAPARGPGAAPVAILFVDTHARPPADHSRQIAALYGLLPSEAKLAWAVAQGLSMAQACDALGLTRETARNYLKKIYAKTGVGGRTELVHLILTGVLPLA